MSFCGNSVLSSAASISRNIARAPTRSKRRGSRRPAEVVGTPVATARRFFFFLRAGRFRSRAVDRQRSLLEDVGELLHPFQFDPFLIRRTAHGALRRDAATVEVATQDGRVGGANNAAVRKADVPGVARLAHKALLRWGEGFRHCVLQLKRSVATARKMGSIDCLIIIIRADFPKRSAFHQLLTHFFWFCDGNGRTGCASGG